MKYYLGIDGGGSGTRALLVAEDGTLCGRAEAGPSNLNAVDAATVASSLRSAIKACLNGFESLPVVTCFGLAGAESSEVRLQIDALLDSCLPGRRVIISDAAIALEGAFAGSGGMLLIAGTGSVCLGHSGDGEAVRCGGWGHLVDDAGSGNWIGRRAIANALRQFDGRAIRTGLQRAVFDALGISDAEQIVPRLYHPLVRPAELAALAPLVCELAASDDPAAVAIVESAAAELAAMVDGVAKQLPSGVQRLCFGGGLLQHQPILRGALERRLHAYSIIQPRITPLGGAVLRAVREDGRVVDAALVDQLARL